MGLDVFDDKRLEWIRCWVDDELMTPRRALATGHQGRAVQVDPMKPALKAPGTKPLKLKYDELLSSFAFNFNLRRYIKATELLFTVGPDG
jgi:hypothetical protein